MLPAEFPDSATAAVAMVVIVIIFVVRRIVHEAGMDAIYVAVVVKASTGIAIAATIGRCHAIIHVVVV